MRSVFGKTRELVFFVVAAVLASIAGAVLAGAQSPVPQNPVLQNLVPAPLPPLLPPTAEEIKAAAYPVPERPQEPRAAKVYAALEAHCARCHQTGKTEKPLASGGIANILAAGDLERNSHLIRPGLPDASLLYDIFVTRHAPLDVYSGTGDDSEPRPEEIDAVRNWIKDIPAKVQACPERTPIRPGELENAIADAQRIAGQDAKDLRFISFAHLYNACASDTELNAYRQALARLLNGLSWAKEPVTLAAIGPQDTIVPVRLSDLGWIAGHWQVIERAYPQSLTIPVAIAVKTAAASSVPVINADWFAAAASEPPLYYELLGMPSKLSELTKLNGFDADQNIRNGTARRLTVRTSEVTRGNRLIERHTGGRGGVWLAYDFATSSGDQDLFTHPLGPKVTAFVKAPFKPDMVRVMFPLPNNFLAFAIFDAAGNRVDRALPGVEKAYAGLGAAGLEPGTKAGGNCMACHSQGLAPARDEFRAFASDASPLPKDVRDLALAISPSDSEMALLFQADMERFAKAVTAANLDLKATIDGFDPVTALAKRYSGPVDVKVAAAETGQTPNAFLGQLLQPKAASSPLARRLAQGTLPRGEMDALLSVLDGRAVSANAFQGGGFLRDVKTEIGLSVWVERLRPAAGDLITVKAESDAECYLTMISVDAAGKATVLFPNDFEADNLIPANQAVSIPSADSPYQLRFKAEGTETLLARCSTSPVPPTGIEHDFVHQRFTVLGNWETFLQDTLQTDAELRRNPEKAERARIAKTGALTRRQARGETILTRPDLSGRGTLRDGRAVAVLGQS